jgi:integrase/recombinase XerC
VDNEVSEFLRHLAIERNASPGTLRAYRQDLCFAAAFFKTSCQRIEEVTPQMVRACIARLGARGYASATIQRKAAAIRSFFRYLVRQGTLEVNPADEVRCPRIKRKLPHVLSVENVQRLLAAVASARDRALIETAYSAGLRVSELVGLNLADMDLDAGQVKVRGKGRRERLALLGPPAIAALRALLTQRERVARNSTCDALFLNRSGKRLTTRSVGRLLARYVKLAGIDQRVTPHTLRHATATHCLNAGADVRSVQELLGHRDINSTQRYTHVSTGRLWEVFRKAHPRA